MVKKKASKVLRNSQIKCRRNSNYNFLVQMGLLGNGDYFQSKMVYGNQTMGRICK